MLTGAEIRMHEFKKGVYGYQVDDVDGFLDQVIRDYEAIYSENRILRERITSLQMTIDHYKNMENTMNNSILAAQQAADMLKENARREVDLIVENSKKRITDMFAIYQEVIRRVHLLNSEIKAQLGSQMEIVEKNQARMETISDYFYSEDFKSLLESLEKVSLHAAFAENKPAAAEETKKE